MTKQRIRFWHEANGSPVLITLDDGGCFKRSEGGRTDEGYSWEASVYRYEDGILYAEWHVSARDCDGPIERHSYAECEGCNVRAGVIDSDHRGVVWPRWQHTGACQRDHFAEAAGY